MKNLNWQTAVASILFLLTACGGSSSADTPDIQTGQFIDAPVQGLVYSTATQNGTTDATGLFSYRSGETVSFSLYGQPLLSAPGFKALTPFDIAAGSFNPNYSINLIRLLMTIDEDNNASNGIKLPAYSSPFRVNFDQTVFAFESDANVIAFLASAAAGRSLVSVQSAVEHISSSIGRISTPYTLNLQGKTGRSVMTNSKCSNGLQLGWQYTFGSSSVRLVGNDTFITNNNTICTTTPDETIEVSYADLAQEGAFLSCAPVCSYADMNKVTFVPSDPDGRTAIEWSWHTPNTKKIYSVKTILVDPRNPGQQSALSTFLEVLTLD